MSTPNRSIVVFEDIDALFYQDRSKVESSCPLTFSGLLNGLDGIANKNGQIFVMTTNHLEKLDFALIRKGRIDIQVEFGGATPQQVRDLFVSFYPEHDQLASEFVKAVKKKFPCANGAKALNLSMASLQEHFIRCRKLTASQCIDKLEDFHGEKPLNNDKLFKMYT